MSWDTKTDYCGLEIANTLKCKGSNMNAGGEYLEKAGQSGAICATKPYGANGSPSCEYSILKPGTLTGVKLGKIVTADGKKYALQSFKYECGAGAEPTFSASSREVEPTVDDSKCNHFDVPEFEISPEEVAEILAGAFKLSGDGCELTKCSLEASCTVNVHTVNGVPVASDVHTGHIKVSVTIGQYGEAAPVLAAEEGWDVSSPLTCTDPDSDLPEWTAALSKPLAKSVKA